MNRSKGPGSYHWEKMRASGAMGLTTRNTWISLANYASREGRTSSALRNQIRRGTFGPRHRRDNGRWQVRVAV